MPTQGLSYKHFMLNSLPPLTPVKQANATGYAICYRGSRTWPAHPLKGRHLKDRKEVRKTSRSRHRHRNRLKCILASLTCEKKHKRLPSGIVYNTSSASAIIYIFFADYFPFKLSQGLNSFFSPHKSKLQLIIKHR
jgi:hypothetical protein